jgi:2-isopropylmalate synthase
MKWRETEDRQHWTVPYLPIDPTDIGRKYEADVIRINSQSGKGGIGYIMEQNFGFDLPPKMREHFGYAIKSVSDHQHKELMPNEIYDIFMGKYVNITSPVDITEAHFTQLTDEGENTISATVTVLVDGNIKVADGIGTGRLDAVSNAVKSITGYEYTLTTYQEHALQVGSKSKAVSYVGIVSANGKTYWGAGINTDIIVSSIHALASAINSMVKEA